MTTTRLQLFAICALLALAGAVFAGNDSNDATDPLKEIAGYRDWTRVTNKPILIIDSSAFG
jgi:hypothetical protein